MAHAGKVKKSSRLDHTPARPVRVRQYKHLVLIVCEDERTEKLYFETAFPNLPENTVYVRPVGTGRDPLGVAQWAVAARKKLQDEFRRDVDQVWLVFDKDDADLDPGKTARFEKAVDLAKQEEMRLAFSNEVFELWLLLHFEDVTGPLPRETVYQMLDTALRAHPLFTTAGYHHKKTSQHKQSKPEDVLQAVREKGDEALAHARAEALLSAHGNRSLLSTNPSTRVHLLLQSLRGWIAFHSV